MLYMLKSWIYVRTQMALLSLLLMRTYCDLTEVSQPSASLDLHLVIQQFSIWTRADLVLMF